MVWGDRDINVRFLQNPCNRVRKWLNNILAMGFWGLGCGGGTLVDDLQYESKKTSTPLLYPTLPYPT